jgi:hypothetical protein
MVPSCAYTSYRLAPEDKFAYRWAYPTPGVPPTFCHGPRMRLKIAAYMFATVWLVPATLTTGSLSSRWATSIAVAGWR